MHFFLGIVLGFFLLSDLHGKGGFHVHRSYDLDNNGLEEVLVLNSRNTSAMWIETSLSGENDTLWAYSLGNSGAFACLLYTSPSPRDFEASRMPSSA